MLASMPILRVDDVPEDVLATLRERAAAQGMSLSAYIRVILVTEAEAEVEAEQEPMEDVIARIATREPVDVTDEEIIAAIHEGRR